MEKETAERLNAILGKHKRNYPLWDYNVLTSFEGFERAFGTKATKNRKLYNGKLKCFYYQYFDNNIIKGHGDTLLNHI